ncbi:MAG: hypothetical protein AAFX06_23510 [Planctomycetota bacterium]
MTIFSQTRAKTILWLGSVASRTRFLSLAKSPNESEVVAQTRLEALLTHANQNVPFYKGRIDVGSGTGWGRAALARLPVLEKDDVELNFPDEITDNSDSTDWRLMSTRGTAQRLITVHDFEKRDAGRAAWLRTFQRAGGYKLGMKKVEIPPEVCEIVCGDEDEVEQSVIGHAWDMFRKRDLFKSKSVRDLRGLIEREWVYNTRNYTGFGRYGSCPPDDVLQRYVDRLKKDRPYVIKALATYLVEIAKYLKRTNQTLEIPVLKAMGSRLSEEQRALVEDAFRGCFWDDYGSAEFGCISCEGPLHDGTHIFDDLFVVEIVNAEGNPVEDGELGWVVITDLMNKAMPLLRYRIGDIGRMDHSPSADGLRSPRLYVSGRAHDVLVTSTGRWMTHDDLVDFFETFPGVRCCAVECRGDNDYLLTVVPSDEAVFDEVRFSESFRSAVDCVEGRVDLRRTTTLPAESGGKFRFVRGNLMQQTSRA